MPPTEQLPFNNRKIVRDKSREFSLALSLFLFLSVYPSQLCAVYAWAISKSVYIMYINCALPSAEKIKFVRVAVFSQFSQTHVKQVFLYAFAQLHIDTF